LDRRSALRPVGEALRQEEKLRPRIGVVEGAQQGPVLFGETFVLGSQPSLQSLEFVETGGVELDPSLGERGQSLSYVMRKRPGFSVLEIMAEDRGERARLDQASKRGDRSGIPSGGDERRKRETDFDTPLTHSARSHPFLSSLLGKQVASAERIEVAHELLLNAGREGAYRQASTRPAMIRHGESE